jgi:amino acid adenylation domain-containing protein
MLPDSIRRQPKKVNEWNDTRSNFSAASSIIDLLDKAAVDYADMPAVRTAAGIALTHGHLAAESSRLAECISSIGIEPRTAIGLLADHVPEAIIAIHAVLRAGAFYVPIDARWPHRRMVDVLRSIGVRHIITTEQYIPVALNIGNSLTIIKVSPDADLSVLSTHSGPQTANGTAIKRSQPDDIAYTIFTSGSTGQPKAVAVRHASVVNLIEWFNRRNKIQTSDIMLQVAAFGFDLSVYDVFGIPAAGASIFLLPDAQLNEPEDVASALLESQATLWNSAPAMFSAMTMFLDELPRSRRGALRRIFLSGDWVPMTTPAVIRREFPQATLVALGGATEACVWSNDFVVDDVDPSWRSIPYGYPMQNSRYYVLREDLTPCEIGEAGELYIAGACVAAGYLNDPDLTAERFLPDPWDQGESSAMYRTGDRARWTPSGWVEFLGRLDSQVKIRGFRVELGEVEYAARQVPGVDEAVALTTGDPRSPDLVLALRSSGDLDRATVEVRLAEWLPRYMRPSQILVRSAFPLGKTGKVDRAALRDLFRDVSAGRSAAGGDRVKLT